MVLVVALALSALVLAVVGATGARRRRRPPVVTATRAARPSVEQEERDALLAEVGGPLLEGLDDPGLWLPDGTSIETLYVPVEQVGGDFLGTIEVEEQAVAFIGDVAGHGLDAAIVALTVKERLTDAIADGAEIEEAVQAANRVLRDDLGAFATLFCCRLQGDDLSFVNAGHVPPLVLEGTGDDLAPTGPMLGAVEHDYEAGVVSAGPGDRLLAFTDGVTEAFGARGGLSTGEIRAVAATPGAFTGLADAVARKQPEPVRDDIAAFELTVGVDEEDAPGA